MNQATEYENKGPQKGKAHPVIESAEVEWCYCKISWERVSQENSCTKKTLINEATGIGRQLAMKG